MHTKKRGGLCSCGDAAHSDRVEHEIKVTAVEQTFKRISLSVTLFSEVSYYFPHAVRLLPVRYVPHEQRSVRVLPDTAVTFEVIKARQVLFVVPHVMNRSFIKLG